MLIVHGYKIDRSNLAQVTITSPGGKLVHVFHGGADYHKAGQQAMRWVSGLPTREADPRKPEMDATLACLAFAKGLAADTPGETPCPLCRTGTVRCMKSSYNGHTRGACSTEGCAIGWIE